MPEHGPPMRAQLVAARKRIVAQMDDIDFRATAGGVAGGGGGAPDYRSVYAELREELQQIDALLSGKGSTDD